MSQSRYRPFRKGILTRNRFSNQSAGCCEKSPRRDREQSKSSNVSSLPLCCPRSITAMHFERCGNFLQLGHLVAPNCLNSSTFSRCLLALLIFFKSFYMYITRYSFSISGPNNYRIVRLLGRGSWGEVFIVKHIIENKQVQHF